MTVHATRTDRAKKHDTGAGTALVLAITFATIAFYLGASGPEGSDAYMHLAHVGAPSPLADGYMARLGAPDGSVLQWTEPFDVLLMAAGIFAAPFTEDGWRSALAMGGSLLPAAILGLTVWQLISQLRPLLAMDACAVAAITAFLNPAVVAYTSAGRVDHHAPLLLLAVIFVTRQARIIMTPTARPSAATAATAGVAAGLGVWISPEAMLFVVPGWAALVARRVLTDSARVSRTDAQTAGAQAAVLTLALVVDPPHAGIWVPVLDRLSVLYVAFAYLLLLSLALVHAVGQITATQTSRLAGAALACLATAAGWIAINPTILGGPMAEVDPRIHTWLASVREWQPVWSNAHTWAAAIVLVPGTAVLLWQALRPHGDLGWRLLLACYLPILTIGILELRALYYAAIIAGVGWGLGTRMIAERLGGYPRLVFTMCCLVPFAPIPVVSDATETAGVPCAGTAAYEALAERIPRTTGSTDPVILAPLNAGAPLLWLRPDLGMVGGNYHRTADGIHDTLTFLRAQDFNKAREVALDRDLDYVGVCADTKLPSGTVAARLARGESVPAWLSPVTSHGKGPGEATWTVYAIASDMLAAPADAHGPTSNRVD